LAENVLRHADKHVLAVAGTHGKTTTASMLAWILESAGKNPGFLIGGIPGGFNVSARLTDSACFVIEADEYDTAFFDKRSKFLHYRPRTAIFNNLEYDHADIFPDLAAIETQFHHLVRTIPPSGRIVMNGECDALARVRDRGIWSEMETFGSDSDWRLTDDNHLHYHGQDCGELTVSSPGKMNQMNAIAAIAAAAHVGVEIGDAIAALAKFPGVARRLQTRGTVNGVTVVDDFAHHPTAIAATLAALRQQLGNDGGRILAVFEPRSNTMKLGTMKNALPGSLRSADLVFCYAGGLDWDAAQALAPLGNLAQTFTDLDELVRSVTAAARPDDHILVMSNGGFGGVHDKILAALKNKHE
jgi:UDP-N-acetylmuramate: L-alanyl-gamma-D-glutamyl-meso-diaminopimelate ligase